MASKQTSSKTPADPPRNPRAKPQAMIEDYRRMRGLMATMIYLQDHPKRDILLRTFCDQTLPKMQTDVGRVFIENYIASMPSMPV